MELLLENQKKYLKKLLGAHIEYAIIPELDTSNSAILPEGNCPQGKYGIFFNSYCVFLRIRKDDKREWIKVSPGPDEAIEPWSPIRIENLKQLDYLNIVGDVENCIKTIQENDQFLDNNIRNLGFSRLSNWIYKDKIEKIALLYYHEYCSVVFEHESGMKWCMYCEFDFEFWINFDRQLVDFLLETEYDNSLIIQ